MNTTKCSHDSDRKMSSFFTAWRPTLEESRLEYLVLTDDGDDDDTTSTRSAAPTKPLNEEKLALPMGTCSETSAEFG